MTKVARLDQPGRRSFPDQGKFEFATTATPGPVNVISAMTGARFGPLRSLPYVLGATTTFVTILLVLGLGLRAILEWVERVSLVLTIVGSGYMLWLAYRIVAARGDLRLKGTREYCPGFRAGMITQGMNPKAWIVSLSAISIYVGPHTDYTTRLNVSAGIFYLICAASLAVWALDGFRVARVTGNVATFNKVMALLIVLSVAMVIVKEFRLVWL